MTIATLDDFRSRVHAATAPRKSGAVSDGRISDVWPDWSTALTETELAKSAEKNRSSDVLREALASVLYSVGLAVLLFAVLTNLHIR